MTHWYVGFKVTGGREIFRADVEPVTYTHGERYHGVWGPFRTKRGAMFGASSASVNNPHVQTVADAERIAAS